MGGGGKVKNIGGGGRARGPNIKHFASCKLIRARHQSVPNNYISLNEYWGGGGGGGGWRGKGGQT